MWKLFEVRMPYNFPDEGIGDLNIEDDKLEENEEEVIEEEEKEDKEEEDKEEEEDLITRVEYKEVTKEFPEFFKKFPTLKHAFFREQQFTERFPTVEEADKAIAAQSAYEEITNSVVEGNTDKFIKELSAESSDGLEKFAKNFIPSIREINKDLYFDIISPEVEQFIKNVYNHGKTLDKDEDRKQVQNAAKIVRKILFGGNYEDIEKDVSLISKSKSKDEEKLEKEKQEHLKGKYSAVYNDVTNTCYSKLDEEINKGLDDLTKTKPGLKKLIAKDIKERALKEMESDKNYMTRMEQLWKREQRNGFNGSLKNSFITTFLGKAKTLIPKLRVEARKEALGKEDVKEEKERTRLSGGKEVRGDGKGKMNPERVKREGLTTRGILDAD